MLVSWNWLSDYLALDMPPEEAAHRLAMAGLNHESSCAVGGDLAIDLEVTSNRPDCLGHLGVAREIAVLFDRPLHVPAAQPAASGPPVEELTRVELECPELCPHYSARVVRGVRIGPSPPWLAQRLETIGIARINNVVDITNYVLLECGQPLHAFDLDQLSGRRIIVRRARPGETLEAIDHREYALDESMCVIADAERPVALGGVMGGAASEVSSSTRSLLIESARFAPRAIRSTARALNLHSSSSYRFERGVDPAGVEWASRRCSQLILEICGGELAAGVIHVGQPVVERRPIVLRLDQLPRVLGIDVPVERVRAILAALGMEERQATSERIEVVPPSWRADVSREIDLVEEVGRIYGYDQIPEDVGVAMAPSHRSDDDRVLERVRQVLTAGGFDEAMTASMVPESWCQLSPWTESPPLRSLTPMLKGADTLRTSLVPSLLEARRVNQAAGNAEAELFETAHVYLPRAGQLPCEQPTVAMVADEDFLAVKGIVEAVLDSLHVEGKLEVRLFSHAWLAAGRSVQLWLDDRPLGWLADLSREARKQFGLRSGATVAELDLSLLAEGCRLVPQYRPPSAYPATEQDLNLVMDERVPWAELAASVREAGGELLEKLEYRETYRDARQDGPNKKRLLLTITLRAHDKTLTGDDAAQLRERILDVCRRRHGASLLA